MKISKLFTIDADLCEKLKNINASELVSNLLEQHFSIFNNKSSLLEQKKGILDDIKKKKRLFPIKLKLLMSLKRWVSTHILKGGLKLDQDVLLYWNCRHIAEVEGLKSRRALSKEAGRL